MKKRRFPKFITPIILVAVLAIVVPVLSSCLPGKAPAPAPAAPAAPAAEAPAAEAPPEEVAPVKTVNIGAVFALTGPAAGWALPGLTGLNMAIDDINAAGGLQVGDERYLVNLVVYDDEHSSSKALQGVKKLVLEHEVKYVTALSAPPADAIAPFLTEHEIYYTPLEPTIAHPDYPYLVVGQSYGMDGDVSRTVFTARTHPEIERVALLCQNDPLGYRMQAWVAAGWESMDVDIVYRELFAVETTDFAPIMTAMLATNPDVLDFHAIYPGYSEVLIGLAYDQGFDGMIVLVEANVEALLAEAPGEWLEEHYVQTYPAMDDPWWGDPSMQHDFYDKWEARYGSGGPEDQFRKQTSIDWVYAIAFQVWVYGVEAAGTFDAEAVKTAVKATDGIQTFEGPIYWPPAEAAIELFGINNWFQQPTIMATITADGKLRIITGSPELFEDIPETDFWGVWYPQYGDILLAELERSGVAWYQR